MYSQFVASTSEKSELYRQMQLTEGSCFFGCFLKQFLVDVYSTAEITRLTNQREEFLVLYILIYTTFLAAFLGYAPSIKCAQVHRILVKKKFNLWRLQAANINEFEISVSL